MRPQHLVLPIASLIGLALGVCVLPVLWEVTQSRTSIAESLGTGSLLENACSVEQHGVSSIGLYFGQVSSELSLYNIELLKKETANAFPVANPVFTAAHVGSPVTSVSKPFLFSTNDGKLFMFYEALICPEGKTLIAAAESADEGVTWKSLGSALQEPWHLSSPLVFEYRNAVYMIPSSPEAGVRLYRAASFPLKWKLVTVLQKAHLHNPSVVERPDGAGWMMMASRAAWGAGSGGEDAILELYLSNRSGTKGLTNSTWRRHPASPAAVESATQAGRLLRVGGGLYRFGRSCSGGRCGPIHAFMLHVGPETFEQDEAELQIGRSFWRQGSSWDAAGATHIDILPQPDGRFVAAVSAASAPFSPPPLAGQLETALLLLRALAVTAAFGAVWTVLSGMAIIRHMLLQRPWGQQVVRRFSMESASKAQMCCTPPSRGSIKAVLSYGDDDALWRAPQDLEQFGSGGKPQLSRRGTVLGLRPTTWQALGFAVLVVSALAGIAGGRHAAQVMEPFWQPTGALAVDGTFSRYTIMIMSYESRLSSLKWAVKHYSQCPSAGEVLVVWNKGAPPDPRRDLESLVPVRVRVEANNSMNNRFRPDPRIRFRGVLSVDDDIMVPCSTIEAAFAAWRLRPRRLVGLFPLLLEADVEGGPLLFRGEQHAVARGAYNMIEPGAAFLDSQSAFGAYYAEAVAPARQLVDQSMNCDDLLLNFVLANASRAALTGAGPDAVPLPAVQWMRPERRIDISRLSGVGLSHDLTNFKRGAETCLAAFTELFGGNPLQLHAFEWDEVNTKPRCSSGGLWCTYN